MEKGVAHNVGVHDTSILLYIAALLYFIVGGINPGTGRCAIASPSSIL